MFEQLLQFLSLDRVTVLPWSSSSLCVRYFVSSQSRVVLVKQMVLVMLLLVFLLANLRIISVEDLLLFGLLVCLSLCFSRETLWLLSSSWCVIVSELEFLFLLLVIVQSGSRTHSSIAIRILLSFQVGEEVVALVPLVLPVDLVDIQLTPKIVKVDVMFVPWHNN